jgi:glycosyl-4,4'-diaponeurosporenoate acyltransferase
MRLIYLSTFWTVIIDIIAWFVIHLAVVFVAVRIPRSYFKPDNLLFRTRIWEKNGRLYQSVFGIKKWKALAPDGAGWFRDRGFPKKKLKTRNVDYLKTFLIETCRAEWTHWIIILFAPFFFLWNKPFVGFIMILYATLENLPLIMIQRYNRERLRRITNMPSDR